MNRDLGYQICCVKRSYRFVGWVPNSPNFAEHICEQRRSNKIRKVVFEVLPFVSFTIIAILVMSPQLLPGRTDVVMRALSLLQFLSQCGTVLK